MPDRLPTRPPAAAATSLRAYARHRGVSLQAVRKAIAGGRLREALTEDRKVADVALADREWAEFTDYARSPQRAPIPAEDLRGAAARLAHYRAATGELEYEQRAGELVNAAEMQAAMTATYSVVRSRLLALTTTAAHQLPHLSVTDLAAINSIVSEAIEALTPHPKDGLCGD
jgi:phage terminase Nu1 subunit (DNA packaging protein)